MKQSSYNQLKSFIWSIADDCLVEIYPNSDYRKIILPFFVLRRFDALLEKTHDQTVQVMKTMDFGTADPHPALQAMTGLPFSNTSQFTLKTLTATSNKQNLKQNFLDYLAGFSEEVKQIIDKFGLYKEIDTLVSNNILRMIIDKFTDSSINLSSEPVLNADGTVRLEALDNHTMGTLFEDIIRQFNEETNVTDAGKHFTPRDIVELIAELAFTPVKDKIKDQTYSVYDGACGTGGILSVAEEHIEAIAKEHNKKVSIDLYGQELAPDTFAIAKADMLIKGQGKHSKNIFFDSTISRDGLNGQHFDFMLSNPPFGTPWKKDLEKWDIKDAKEITDRRFKVNFDGKNDFSLVPDIGDPQLLFLANNVAKMTNDTELGSRIVEVHNGSSLFSCGNGGSNLRRYIIEQDMLEAIIAMPENMFYNTGIGTYLWIVTNRKPENRKGFVQLIDATEIKAPLRKNLGEKNCEISEEGKNKILKLYMDYDKADPKYSKIFPNKEFGYWSVDVLRPLRLAVTLSDENIAKLEYDVNDAVFISIIKGLQKDFGNEVITDYSSVEEKINLKSKELKIKGLGKKITAFRADCCKIDTSALPVKKADGIFESDNNLKDSEQIPLLYEGGMDAYFEKEVKPYVTDAWIDKESVVIGYSLSFTKYFYKPLELRSIKEIVSDIQKIESETKGSFDELVKGIC